MGSASQKLLLMVKCYSWQILLMWKMGSQSVLEPQRGGGG